MVVRRSILFIAVFLGSLNLNVSADEAMDSLCVRQDEISLRLDKILQRAENEGWSDTQLITFLMPIAHGIWAEHHEKRDEPYKKRRDDTEHFANRVDATEVVKAKITEIMKADKFYSGYNPDEVSVVDMLGRDVAILSSLKSCAIYIYPGAPVDSPCRRQRFPKAKAILMFDPYRFSTQAELESCVGHELAHMTQVRRGVYRVDDPVFRFYTEIDADIRNICKQKKNGMWTLRENGGQIIDDFCAYLNRYNEQVKDHVKNQLITGLEGNPTKKKFLERVNYYGQVIEMDGQGRLLIPSLLRDSAQIKGEVAVLGNLTFLEVRNLEVFRKQIEEEKFTPEDESTLDKLGI